jgi:hypothetical protein
VGQGFSPAVCRFTLFHTIVERLSVATGEPLCVPRRCSDIRAGSQQLFMTTNTPTQPLSACMGLVFTPVWIFFR